MPIYNILYRFKVIDLNKVLFCGIVFLNEMDFIFKSFKMP